MTLSCADDDVVDDADDDAVGNSVEVVEVGVGVKKESCDLDLIRGRSKGFFFFICGISVPTSVLLLLLMMLLFLLL